MTCRNCGHTVKGNFCSQCGQNSKVDRINFSSFAKDISDSIFQINRGFFYTLTELFVRPGASLKDFLHGKRKSHFKPITYVLTLSTVYFLITQFTNQNTWIDDALTGWMNGATGQSSGIEIPQIAIWFSENYAYSTLLLLPVFSLASYLSFFKFGRNYLEHVVVNSYVTGHQAIFYSIFAIGRMYINSDFMENIPLLVAISYTFWVFWQFFSEGNRIVNILRSIFTYFLYLLFCLVLLFGLMGIYEL